MANQLQHAYEAGEMSVSMLSYSSSRFSRRSIGQGGRVPGGRTHGPSAPILPNVKPFAHISDKTAEKGTFLCHRK